MKWAQVLEVLRRACSEQGEERRVLLVLPDASFHVREVLSAPEDPIGEGDLLGFIVYGDDPDLSKRTDETRLLFASPGQIQRILVQGYDTTSGQLGF